jgi:hypothetical protein
MKKEKNIYFPLFASRQLNGGFQSEGETDTVWKAIQELPQERRDILLSQNMAEAIAVLDDKYHVPEQFVEYVTVLIRDLFLGNFSEVEVLRAFRGEFSKIPNLQIDPIIQYIQLNILKVQPDPEPVEEEEAAESVVLHPENLKKYTLLDALARFPNIGNQFITSESIKLKNQVTPVRPSLSNWLKNYRDEIGIGKHDAVARAGFLFESSNTRKLSSEERERLHAVVRSLEDNELLEINIKTQEILFPEEKKILAPPYSQSSSTPSTDPLAREELTKVGTQTFVARNIEEQDIGTPKGAGGMMGRTKNMVITPSRARTVDDEASIEPLGTIRFSTKHVFPAEKYQVAEQKYSSMPTDPRIEHFRPRGVTFTESAPVSTSSQVNDIPEESKAVVSPIQPRNVQPSSIFRIKPNK